MDDHATDARAQWEELGMRVESATRAAVLRRPSIAQDVPHPPPTRGLLRRMSHGFAAAGAVSLGVQEWPTDWTRSSFSAGSPPSSVAVPSSLGTSSSLKSFARWQRAPGPGPTHGPAKTTTSAPSPGARRDSLHSQEQECVMDMACLI